MSHSGQGAVRDHVQSLSGSEPTAVADIVLTQAHFDAALAAIQAADA